MALELLGVGCDVWGGGCGVWNLGCGVWGLGFGVRGEGFGLITFRTWRHSATTSVQSARLPANRQSASSFENLNCVRHLVRMYHQASDRAIKGNLPRVIYHQYTCIQREKNERFSGVTCQWQHCVKSQPSYRLSALELTELTRISRQLRVHSMHFSQIVMAHLTRDQQ